MAKPQTATTEAKKPSIRFVPSRRQYESGITYVDVRGYRHKITLEGWVAPSVEDERRLLSRMEHDPFCGITTWENREIPAEQKQAETQVRALEVQNKAMAVEMEAMRKQIADLQAAQGRG